eukprot:scaffold748_cov251-Pinguiococcus_pyrenoidosus.AAC.18
MGHERQDVGHRTSNSHMCSQQGSQGLSCPLDADPGVTTVEQKATGTGCHPFWAHLALRPSKSR